MRSRDRREGHVPPVPAPRSRPWPRRPVEGTVTSDRPGRAPHRRDSPDGNFQATSDNASHRRPVAAQVAQTCVSLWTRGRGIAGMVNGSGTVAGQDGCDYSTCPDDGPGTAWRQGGGTGSGGRRHDWGLRRETRRGGRVGTREAGCPIRVVAGSTVHAAGSAGPRLLPDFTVLHGDFSGGTPRARREIRWEQALSMTGR